MDMRSGSSHGEGGEREVGGNSEKEKRERIGCLCGGEVSGQWWWSSFSATDSSVVFG